MCGGVLRCKHMKVSDLLPADHTLKKKNVVYRFWKPYRKSSGAMFVGVEKLVLKKDKTAYKEEELCLTLEESRALWSTLRGNKFKSVCFPTQAS